MAAVICGLLFAADITSVESGITAAPDRSLELAVHAAFGPGFYHFFEAVSFVGGAAIRVALIGLIVVGLLIKRYGWGAALVVAATGGAALLATVVKIIVGRSRPHLFPAAVHTSGSSFPSGHATNACALALVTIYLLWHVFQHRGLTILGATIGGVFALLVGLSRLVLGVHFPTDVLGGYALAGAWFALTIALLARVLQDEALLASWRRYGLFDS